MGGRNGIDFMGEMGLSRDGRGGLSGGRGGLGVRQMGWREIVQDRWPDLGDFGG